MMHKNLKDAQMKNKLEDPPAFQSALASCPDPTATIPEFQEASDEKEDADFEEAA